MRVWVDLTNSPHVLVMRPLIEAMRADGHEVEVTARDFAQTLQLLERFGIAHTAIGRHRGGRLGAQGARAGRGAALALTRWARGRGFDIAMGHGSNDVSVAAKLLRIPAATAFDYEYADRRSTSVNCRLCRAVVVPDAIPPERLSRYGATPASCAAYEGLKEEYYLADFEPYEEVLGRAGARPLAAARRRPHAARRLALPPLREPALRGRARAAARDARPWCCRARRSSARSCAGSAASSSPSTRIDAQSLIAFADLVDLGRRHDEPRGGRARHARLHDVRGPAGRRRRAAAPARGVCAGSTDPGRGRASSAAIGTAACGSGETRARLVGHCSSSAIDTHEIALTSSVNGAPPATGARIDACLLALAYYLAFVLRFDSGIPHRYEQLLGGHDRRDRREQAPDLRRCSGSTPSSGASSTRRTSSRSCRRSSSRRIGRDRVPVRLLDRQARPAARRARARLPADADVRQRRRFAVRAVVERPTRGSILERAARRGADRRRRQRRPAGGLRAAPQPGPAQRTGRLRRRRPAQAGHAHRRASRCSARPSTCRASSTASSRTR